MTVAQLAKAAGLDVEEALIRLWESGLERYLDPVDRVRRDHLDDAYRAVGLPSTKELTNPRYWMGVLQMDDRAFRDLLAHLGTPMTAGARTLPKGAVAKLRRYTRARGNAISSSMTAIPAGEEPAQPLVWRRIGHEQPLRLLTEEEIESIHWELVQDFQRDADPIYPPGVRDEQLLASAVYRQHTSLGLGDEAKYPTVQMAAAALLHAVVHDHPFFNGNKRTGVVAMLVLLDENGVILECPEDELFQVVLRLAKHQLVAAAGTDRSDRETLFVAEWLHERSRRIEKGDRPIQWRKLKQILRGFDCELSHPSGVGNRINIRRRVTETTRFGRARDRTLSTQVVFTDDGREAGVETVKKIRRDLRLDEENGIDSLTFYRRGGISTGDFIVRYRKVLKRLARL